MTEGPEPVVRLREMTRDEYDAWYDHAVRAYADDKVAAGRWSPAEAVERSAAEFATLLPDGLRTKDMLVFTAEDAEGEPVGIVWLALAWPAAGPQGTAWVFDIEVHESRRGQGYGRALLAAAEDELRVRRVDAVALNVFGTNAAAIALYASAGYRVTSQQMRKELG